MTAPDVAPAWHQFIYCAVCLELQDIPGKDVEMAITIVEGTAVCDEHRRRVDGFQNAVFGARKFHQRRAEGIDRPYRK